MTTVKDASLLVVDARSTNQDPTSPKTKSHIPSYSVTLNWYTADFTVSRAKSVIKTSETFIQKHGATLGLMPGVTLSTDIDLAA